MCVCVRERERERERESERERKLGGGEGGTKRDGGTYFQNGHHFPGKSGSLFTHALNLTTRVFLTCALASISYYF